MSEVSTQVISSFPPLPVVCSRTLVSAVERPFCHEQGTWGCVAMGVQWQGEGSRACPWMYFLGPQISSRWLFPEFQMKYEHITAQFKICSGPSIPSEPKPCLLPTTLGSCRLPVYHMLILWALVKFLIHRLILTLPVRAQEVALVTPL